MSKTVTAGMVRLLLFTLVVVALAYVGLVLLVFFQQRSLIFPAPPLAREPRLEGAALLRLQGPQGLPVAAFHVPAPAGAATVVHFHGNAEQLADVVPLAWLFREAGLGFYAVEYPGYGLTLESAPSEATLYAAAETALTHLHTALGVPVERTVLQGQSLGSGVAVEMARRGHGARMVLLSPYTSLPELGARLMPWLPGRWLVRDRFDSAAKAPGLKLPALVFHGTEDDIIPVDMGQRMAELLPRATLKQVQGAGHNDLLDTPGLLQTVIGFCHEVEPPAVNP